MRPALILLLLLSLLYSLVPTHTKAQTVQTTPTVEAESAPIQDNSFLLEEAYNQEDGVIQHISYFQIQPQNGDWVYTQTDEWPLRSLKHQLSVTLSAAHDGLGQSFIWLATARVNFLVETIWISNQYVSGPNKTAWSQELYVSPGIRWAYNLRSGLQIVPGLGIPVGIGPSAGQKGIIAYLSFEHPFAFAHSRGKGPAVKE